MKSQIAITDMDGPSNLAKAVFSSMAKKRTRINMVADATNIPAAMILRSSPSTARCERWRVTPVEETSPARKPASKMPRSVPAILTAQYAAKDIRAIRTTSHQSSWGFNVCHGQ